MTRNRLRIAARLNDRFWPTPAVHLVIDSVAGADPKQPLTEIAMLELSDPKWGELKSGYRLAYDPRNALASLESGSDDAWHELWEELHHQGDVDTASYAAVPHVVRIYNERKEPDWNVYALVGVVALSVGEQNPDIPDWLDRDFRAAIDDLAEIGAREVMVASDPVLVQSILGIIALAKGHKNTGRVLLAYEEYEIGELISE